MRAADRRRQLLEVAARLFAAGGYRGTTTAELAAEAGVTEPVLYRHFESKLDLFVTLVDEVGGEVIAAWRERLEEACNPADRLRALLEGNPATHPRGRAVYRVIFHAMTEPREETRILAAIRRHLSRLHAFLRDELATLQGDGVVRTDEPPSALAWLLINAGIGAGMVNPLGPPRLSASEKRGIVRLLEDLVR